MAGKAAPPVPKFGSWDAENIGYTVFFEKVRENKGTPVPAAAAPAPRGGEDYDFDPYEHYENLSRKAASRPPSSQGHGHGQGQGHGPAPQHPAQRGTGYHRRNGSNGSNTASEASSRASKFSPPRPYQPRYGNNSYQAQQGGDYGGYGGGAYAAPAPNSYPAQQSGVGYGGGAYAAPAPNSYQAQQGGGGGGYNAGEYAAPAPNSYPAQQGGGGYNAGGAYAAPPAPRHNHQYAAPRVAASPPRHAPPPVNERTATTAARPVKPSAVPKFGVWDEQNTTAASQGFTVQFEKVKRHREVAKAATPDVPPQQISPEQLAPAWQQRPQRKPRKSFMSKICRCLFPRVREGL